MSQISRQVPDIKWNDDDELRRRDFYGGVDFRLRRLNVQLVGDCGRSRCQLNEHKTCTNDVHGQFNEIIIDSGWISFEYLRPPYKQVPGWRDLRHGIVPPVSSFFDACLLFCMLSVYRQYPQVWLHCKETESSREWGFLSTYAIQRRL